MTKLAEAAKEAGMVQSSNNAIAVASNPFGLEGLEGISGKHLTIASLCLVQNNSAHFIEAGVAPGKIASTLDKTAVENPVVIPVFITEKFYVYKYDGDSEELLFVADNDKDPRLAGKTTQYVDGKKPEIIPTIVVLAILNGNPVKINFRKASGHPAGKKLISLAVEAWRKDKAQLFDRKYLLKSYKTQNKKGTKYYALDVDAAGTTTAEESAMGKSLANTFKTQPVVLGDTEEVVPF